jgi:hypothetical protein
MLIDINGDSLPDRVFDRNPANDQKGFYPLLATIKAMTCIEIDIEPLLIIGWISVKYSIRQAVAIYINQHRIFTIFIFMGWAVFPIFITT